MDNESAHPSKLCLACGNEFASEINFCPYDGERLVDLLEDPLIGEMLADRYEIQSVLGRGGMGVVYKGRHQMLERDVAVKILHPSFISNSLAVARFQQEARSVSTLSHPNIISIHDFGVSQKGIPFLVMDYLSGKTLCELIADNGAIGIARSVNIFLQICDALHHAHRRGAIHRDIKPSNIMLVENDDAEDLVKLLDFGIAKLLPSPGRLLQKLTQTGEVFGTPLYMSPEQCMGQEIDSRSDIYALGCVLYEMLTGEPPIQGDNVLGTVFKHINFEPIVLSALRPDLDFPERLEAIVLKMMEKQPAKRYQSVADLKTDLIALTRSLGNTPASQRQVIEESQLPEARLSGPDISSAVPSIPEEELKSRADAYEAERDRISEQRQLWALKNEERLYGSDSNNLVPILSNLAEHYKRQHRYEQAEPLFERLINLVTICEGPESTAAYTANLGLADVSYGLGDHTKAEALYRTALAIAEKCHGSRHPDVAMILDSLGSLYRDGRDFEKAESMFQRAIQILEACFGPDSTMLSWTLVGFGLLRAKERDYAEAESLYRRAFELMKAADGVYNEDVSRILGYVGNACLDQEKYSEAEEILREVLDINEKVFGWLHPEVAYVLDNLGWLFYIQHEYAEAESFYRRALEIREKLGEPNGPDMGLTLTRLADACREMDKDKEAERLYRRAVSSLERSVGTESTDVAVALVSLGYLYIRRSRMAEAEEAYGRALRIRKAALGENDQSVAQVLQNLGWCKEDQGKEAEAEGLYLQSLKILEQIGTDDAKFDLESVLNNLVDLYSSQERYEEAEKYRVRLQEMEGDSF